MQILETTMKNSPPADMSNVPDLTLNITNSHVEGTMDKSCNGTLPMCTPSSLFELIVHVLKMYYRLIFLLNNKRYFWKCLYFIFDLFCFENYKWH